MSLIIACNALHAQTIENEKSKTKDFTSNRLYSRIGINVFSYGNLVFEKKSSSKVNLFSTIGIKHGVNLLLRRGFFCNDQYIQEVRKKRGVIGGLGLNFKFKKEPKLNYILYAEYRRNFINRLILDEACNSLSSFTTKKVYNLRVNELSGVFTISQPVNSNVSAFYLSIGFGKLFGSRTYSDEGNYYFLNPSSRFEKVSTFIIRFDVGFIGLLSLNKKP